MGNVGDGRAKVKLHPKDIPQHPRQCVDRLSEFDNYLGFASEGTEQSVSNRPKSSKADIYSGSHSGEVHARSSSL